MSDQQVDEFLEHFGIKGMRWGVRNQQKLDRVSRVARGTELKKQNSDHGNRNRNLAIAAGASFAAGLIATSLIMHHRGFVKMHDLRIEHKDFMESKKLLDGKLKERMSYLKDLANMTSPGHPSHEGAINEIKNLHSFHQARLAKMASRYKIDAKTLKKMKVGSFV